MERALVYPGQIPLETDVLRTNRYAMVGLGMLALDMIGSSTVASGFACTPTSPASLAVSVAAGRVYALKNIDDLPFSSLPADTNHQILKQGISLDPVILPCAAPASAGYSINYLVQVSYVDSDTNLVTLPYYNSGNPAAAYSGPNNQGTAQATSRKGAVLVQLKPGAAAPTGSQSTPAPDIGFIGLWVVTVANGATTVVSANIAQYPGAPFLGISLSAALTASLGDARYLQLYAATAAEVAAGATPNTARQWGDVLRYGADPTGVSDSSGAFAAAIASNSVVYDGYPGGGTYRLNSTVILRSFLKIQGATKNINGTGRGTVLILGTAAGANAAMFRATGFISDFRVSDLTITWQTVSTGQIGFLFDVDCRSSRWDNVAFVGATASNTNVTGIKFTGGGTFTGDVTIEKGYFTALQIGISMSGSCSTVRILSNEMYSNPTIPNSRAIQHSGVGGQVISFNTFQGWGTAIFTASGSLRQFMNYFEGNVSYDFDWGTTTNGISIGDYPTGTPLARYRYDNSSGNMVLGAYGFAVDSNTLGAYRGFMEQGRSVANGHWQTRTFNAANYTGAGSMTWTVSGGSVITECWEIDGNTCTLNVEIQGTGAGGSLSTALVIALPVTPTNTVRFPCEVHNNGNNVAGVAIVSAGVAAIQIYADSSTTTNWTAGTVGVSVSARFQINSVVP